MIIITISIYLLLCALCAWVAGEKNRSGVAWFIVALIFSPLIALICLAAVPAKTAEQVVMERMQRDRKVGFYGMNY